MDAVMINTIHTKYMTSICPWTLLLKHITIWVYLSMEESLKIMLKHKDQGGQELQEEWWSGVTQGEW